MNTTQPMVHTTSEATATSDCYRLPDPPEREPDDMTSAQQLSENGNHHALKIHLGKPDRTIVAAERRLGPVRQEPPEGDTDRFRYPDLLVAFDVNPALFQDRNGYLVSDQGKPPDFILEIASQRTGHIDIGAKRREYAALGITEYWRFDETGKYHHTRLAGDRLVDGAYQPIEIEELPNGNLRAYSTVLDLYLQWDDGQLFWCNAVTGLPIPNQASETERANTERQIRINAEAEAVEANQRAAAERQARLYAEARVAELEAQLRAQQI